MEPQNTETGKRLRFLVSISFLLSLPKRWIEDCSELLVCATFPPNLTILCLYSPSSNVDCHLSFPTCVCTSVGSFIARHLFSTVRRPFIAASVLLGLEPFISHCIHHAPACEKIVLRDLVSCAFSVYDGPSVYGSPGSRTEFYQPTTSTSTTQ